MILSFKFIYTVGVISASLTVSAFAQNTGLKKSLAEGEVFIVQDSLVDFEDFEMGDRSTIRIANSKFVTFRFRTLTIGENCQILGQGVDGGDGLELKLKPSIAESGKNGAIGIPGNPGVSGTNGVSIKLEVNNINSLGSLLVDLSGGNGGSGSVGGPGEKGGKAIFHSEGNQDNVIAGDGGEGGKGGDAGIGGNGGNFELAIGRKSDVQPTIITGKNGPKIEIITFRSEKGKSGSPGISGSPGEKGESPVASLKGRNGPRGEKGEVAYIPVNGGLSQTFISDLNCMDDDNERENIIGVFIAMSKVKETVTPAFITDSRKLRTVLIEKYNFERIDTLYDAPRDAVDSVLNALPGI